MRVICVRCGFDENIESIFDIEVKGIIVDVTDYVVLIVCSDCIHGEALKTVI